MHWFSVCSIIVCFTGILDKQGMVDFVDWRYESDNFASCICDSEIGWCYENNILGSTFDLNIANYQIMYNSVKLIILNQSLFKSILNFENRRNNWL